MAKRIVTDAKIVLERAGYVVSYVYGKRSKVVWLNVKNSKLEDICMLPVNANCWIDNDLIEELIQRAA